MRSAPTRLTLFVAIIAVLLLGLNVVAFSPAPAPFWWLNTYLKSKSIGHFEPGALPNGFVPAGPCPTFNKRCTIDFATLPSSIKDIGVELPAPFDGTFTLGEAIPKGDMDVWLTEISDFEVADVKVSGESISPSRERIDIHVERAKLNLRTNLRFVDLLVPGTSSITLIEIDVVVNAAKSAQSKGTNITLSTFLDAPAGKTFSNSLPRDISLNTCSMQLDMGLTVQLISGFPFNGVTNGVLNFVIGVIQPVLNYVICHIVVEQAFITVNDEPGIVKVLLDRIFQEIGDLAGKPDPNINTEELALVNALSADQKQAEVFSFKNSSLVHAVSQVVDEWLGVGNPPKVNEVVSLLTNPVDGTLVLSDLQQWGVSVRVPTPPFYLNIDLLEATISGLHTFKQGGFALLQQLTRDFTFRNQLKMNNLGVSFTANIKLQDNFAGDADGGWIFNRNLGSPTSASFQLSYNVSIDDIDLQAWVSAISDITQLLPLQLGQIFGKSGGQTTAFQQLIDAGKCGAPALYGFALPFFELSVGDIDVLGFKMTPIDQGITTLVNDVTEMGLRILESGIQTNLPDISQHWIRPLGNELLRDLFVAGGINATCPSYEDAGVPIYPNFLGSTLFATFSTIIRDVVGGNPVQPNAVNINELIRIATDILIRTFHFPGTNPAPGEWRYEPDFRAYPGKSFVGDQPSFRDTEINLGYIRFFGFDTVRKLLIETLPGKPNGFDLDFEMDAVGFGLQSRWTVDYTVVPNYPGRANFIDEGVTLDVLLSGFKIRAKPVLNYDLNVLYMFQLKEVLNVWCLLAPLVSGELDISVSIDDVQVNIVHQTFANSVSNNELQVALNLVSSETHPNLENMVNYILKSSASFIRSFVTRQLPGLDTINVQSCLTMPNPLDTVAARVVSRLLTSNFTDIALRGLGAQPLPLTPAQADANVFVPFFGEPLDFTDSFFAPLVNDFITRIEPSEFLKFMQVLGNSTSSDILSDLFETDVTDGSVGIDADLTAILGTEGFPLDFAIENATLLPLTFKLSRLSNLDLDDISVLEPVGKFVTSTHLSFPGTMTFALGFAIQFPKNFKNPLDSPTEFFTVDFNVEFDLIDLMIDLELVTALDLKRFTSLSIGNFVTLNETTLLFGINWNFVDCLFGLFYENGLNINKFLVSLETSQPNLSINPNTVISQGTEQTLLAMVRIIFDFYILDFADITQGFIRTFINDLILIPNVNRPKVCQRATVPNVAPDKRIFNFLTNPTVKLVNDFLTGMLAGEDGSYSLFNTVLETAFMATTFFRYKPDQEKQTLGFNNLALVYKKQKLGFVNASVSDIKIRGGGTFKELNVLQPQTNVTFYNEIELAGPSSLEFSLRYSVNGLFQQPVKDELKLKFSISNVTIAAMVTMELAIPELMVVPLGGLTNISQVACALAAVEKLQFKDPRLDFNDFYAEATCIGTCNSPLLEVLQNGGVYSTASFDSLQSVLSFVPGAIGLLTEAYRGSGLQQWIDDAIANSEDNCRLALNMAPLVTVINAPSNSEFAVSIICALAIAGIVGAFVVLAPLSIPRHYQLKDRLLADHLRAANEEKNATAQSVARYMAKMERDALALAWHPAVSRKAKIIVPIVGIVNIVFLFLSFLVFAAFSVDANANFLGNKSINISLIPLTIGLLIDNLYNSGAFILGIGLVILSCVWPILKNMILLIIFYAPKWILHPDRRRTILHVMDILGKYSFIEGFVMVIVAGAIRFTINASEIPLLQGVPLADDLLTVNILVTVDGGMVILCVAAMATLVLNHYVIWQHDKAQYANRRLFKQIDGKDDMMLTPKSEVKFRSIDYQFSTKFITRTRLIEHVNKHGSTVVPNEGPNDHFEVRVQNLVILATGVTSLALLIGQCLPFYTFQYDGLIGLSLELLIENGNTRTYSLMSLGIQVQSLSDGTALTNFKLFFFQFLWYMAIIVTPHVQLWLHLVVWMIPFKLDTAKKVFFFAKAAGYWASVEVFAIATIAIIIEVDRIVAYLIDFVVGGSCSAAEPYLEQTLPSNGVCLRTSARVEYGFYVAWFAMMAQVMMGIIMIRANELVLRDREDVLEERPHRMWSWSEYFVLRFMFAFGAEHHRPYLNPTSTIIDRYILLLVQWFEDPKKTTMEITKDLGETTKKSTKSCCGYLCGCFRGVDSISIEEPYGHTAPSKWHAPPAQNPHHHVASGAGEWNVPPQPTQKASKWNQPSTARLNVPSSQQQQQQQKPPASASGGKWSVSSMRLSKASARTTDTTSAPPVPPPPKSLKVPKNNKSLPPPPVPPPSSHLKVPKTTTTTTLSPPPGLENRVVVSQSTSESTNPIFKREKTFSIDV